MAKTAETYRLELAGQRFARWSVVKKADKRGKHGEVYWWCLCDCGAYREVVGSTLRDGRNTSCGCASRDRSTKHGMEKTPTYTVWAQMKTRCQNPRHRSYADYGARGITVCDRWQAFEAFFADMGEQPAGRSLDRIDNSLGYEPDNCRWATSVEQNRNTRGNKIVEFEGRAWVLAELAEAKGIPPRKLAERLRRGWPLERAVRNGRQNRWSA